MFQIDRSTLNVHIFDVDADDLDPRPADECDAPEGSEALIAEMVAEATL